MKKTAIILAFLCIVSLPVFAQERNITLPEKPNRPEYVDYSSLEKGFFGAVQLAPTLSFDRDGNKAPIYQIDLIVGYRFGEFFRLGAGVSPRINEMKNLPIYADFRGNFISQRSRACVPYWSIDVGYTLNQGMYLAPTAGIRIGGLRHDFVLGIGYFYQAVQAMPDLNCAVLRLGYEF